MDPHEEQVVKLYIASIIGLIAFAVVFGSVATVQKWQLATPPMTATVHNSIPSI